MEATLKSPRHRASFRLQTSLLEQLRTEARRSNISLNHLVETMLADQLAYAPNDTTVAAMQETLSGAYAGTIDTSSTEAFISSILGDEAD